MRVPEAWLRVLAWMETSGSVRSWTWAVLGETFEIIPTMVSSITTGIEGLRPRLLPWFMVANLERPMTLTETT